MYHLFWKRLLSLLAICWPNSATVRACQRRVIVETVLYLLEFDLEIPGDRQSVEMRGK